MCVIFLKLKNLKSESPKVIVQCQAELSLGCDTRADCNAVLQWWVPWPMPHSVILTSRESKQAMTLQPTNSSKGRFQSSDLKPPAASTQGNPILLCKQSSYPTGKNQLEREADPASPGVPWPVQLPVSQNHPAIAAESAHDCSCLGTPNWVEPPNLDQLRTQNCESITCFESLGLQEICRVVTCD